MSSRKRGEWQTNFGDDTMKVAALVAESAFSSGKLAEVAGGHRADIIVELKDDSSSGPGVDGDVKLLARQR